VVSSLLMVKLLNSSVPSSSILCQLCSRHLVSLTCCLRSLFLNAIQIIGIAEIDIILCILRNVS
jgi:hypothetical protein